MTSLVSSMIPIVWGAGMLGSHDVLQPIAHPVFVPLELAEELLQRPRCNTRFQGQCVQGLRNCRKLLRHKSNRKVVESQYRELKNLYTLYYLHRLNTVVNLGILGKISSYPTYPITVILKMAMHLEDPELTGFQGYGLDTLLGQIGELPTHVHTQMGAYLYD